MNKLQIVTDKIRVLLKGTSLDGVNIGCGQMSYQPIREAEVLMALNKHDQHEPVMGVLLDTIVLILKHPNGASNCDWIPSKPLSDQSPETIEFLFNVLNCEG